MASRRDRLALRRAQLGYSQEKFAEAACVATSTVARWEKGSATPYPHQRPKLARLLKVTAEGLADLLSLDTVIVAVSGPTPTALACDEEDDVDRRGFTCGAAAIAAIAAGAAIEPWERLASALGGSPIAIRCP
ncbi:helix-turn-helix transcriptional regulator [Kitasatospora sp. NPDC086801]|uniref:helix-turn-helix transcriptional regulator n=1 Tax=Kitasatospora sp. NPDC086801 TaxID=3364066 RepID=UPI003828947E